MFILRIFIGLTLLNIIAFVDADIVPVNKDVEANTSAVLSCVVGGITEAVTVSWKDSSNVTLTDGSDYTITAGVYDSGSQTTTLNVIAGVSTASTFSCVVTSSEWGGTAISTEVTLNVFAVTLNNRSVVATAGQNVTLTCKITGLTAIASVSWKDPDGITITNDDSYIVDEGTVNGLKEQSSTLIISTSKLAALKPTSTFTCEVITGSEMSKKSMTLTKETFAVAAKNKEVEANTTAVLSCVVGGITKQLDSVSWKDSSNVTLTNGSDYTITAGTYDSGSQTTTLSVIAGVSTASTFSCVVTSSEWVITENKTEVSLDVFGVTLDDRSVVTASDQTISCVINGLSQTAIVSWRDQDGTILISGDNYDVVEGTVDDSEQQNSTLTISTNKLVELEATSVFTCEVTSGAYPESETSSNDMNLTILYTLAIQTQPTDQAILSGYRATFDIVLTADSNKFTVTYEWYLIGEQTVLNSNTAVAQFTTGQLMFGGDSGNKYSCNVTWTDDKGTRNDSNATSVQVGVTITDTCYIRTDLNAQTTLAPEEDYVVNGTLVTTSCSKGYVLPRDYLRYQQTCTIETTDTDRHDVNVTNCEIGCYVELDENASYKYEEGSPLIDPNNTYATIHVNGSAVIHCNQGYVLTSNTTEENLLCGPSTPKLPFKTCQKGCPINKTEHAIYIDGDGLIAPGDSINYTCAPKTVTEDGEAAAISKTCQAGEDVELNACFSPQFDKHPVHTAGSSYIKISITKLVISDSPATLGLADPVNYTCTVYKAGIQKGQDSTEFSTRAQCSINQLASKSTYYYTIRAFWAGATWTSLEYTFDTTSQPSWSNGDGNVTVEIPAVAYTPDTYDIVGYWYGETNSDDSDFIYSVPRRKRATEITKVWDSYDLLKHFQGSDKGAFYLLQDQTYVNKRTELVLPLNILELPKGETFAIAALLCNPDNSKDCVMGAGSVVQIPKDRTVTLVLVTLCAVLGVAFLAGAVLVYRRRQRAAHSARAGFEMLGGRGLNGDSKVFINPGAEI